MPSFTRINADVSTDDLHFIKSVIPQHGILSQLVQRAFAAVAADLKSSGYTTYDPTTSSRALEVFRNGTSPRVDPNANRPDVARPAQGVCEAPTPPSPVAPDVHKATKGGRGKRGTSGGEAKVKQTKKGKGNSK